MNDLAQRYDLAPQQVHLWKREFLGGAESVLASKIKSKRSQTSEEKDQLLKTIDQCKMGNDFLKNALR